MTWPQIYLLLDGALYNAPDLETEEGGDNKTPEFDDEADQLRHELTMYAPLCPELTPQRIEQLVSEFKAKKAQEGDQDGS